MSSPTPEFRGGRGLGVGCLRRLLFSLALLASVETFQDLPADGCPPQRWPSPHPCPLPTEPLDWCQPPRTFPWRWQWRSHSPVLWRGAGKQNKARASREGKEQSCAEFGKQRPVRWRGLQCPQREYLCGHRKSWMVTLNHCLEILLGTRRDAQNYLNKISNSES